MLQAKLIQSFENYDVAHAPLRSMDGLEADYQLLVDVRSFEIKSDPGASAEIAFSARILAQGRTRCCIASVFSKQEA